MRLALLVVSSFALAGCCIDLGGLGHPTDGGAGDGGVVTLLDGGAATDCPAGSFRARGEAACAPLGWTDCGPGFVPSSGGWGCEEVLPVARCGGATREALGQTSCVPVGDCAAAFPPAGARLFVSTTGPLDSTHFHSIEQASLAARAGDLIAIDTGTYPESVELDVPVTLWGRCPAQVILDGATSSYPGLMVRAPSTVRGLTIRGFDVGIQTEQGLTLHTVVVDGNTGMGLYAEQATAPFTVTMSYSVVRGTTQLSSQPTFGIDLALGATLDLRESSLVGNQGANLLVATGNSASLSDCFVADSTSTSDGVGGYGITVPGGSVAVTRTVLAHNTDIGVRASKGATLSIDHSVIRSTRSGSAGYGVGLASISSTVDAKQVFITGTEGVAVTAAIQGTLTVTDSDLVSQSAAPDGDFGDGAYAFDGSSLTLTRVAVVDAARVGAEVFDANSSLVLDHVLVDRTRMKPNGTMGIGVVVGFQGKARIASSALRSSHHSGIYVFEHGTTEVRSTLIRDVAFQTGDVPLGHGVMVQDSPSAIFTGLEVRGAAGIGLAFSNSSAIVSASTVDDNAVGVHVQDGSTLSQVDTPPATPTGNVVTVTTDTVFEGNASRIGVGTVPLPTPIAHP